MHLRSSRHRGGGFGTSCTWLREADAHPTVRPVDLITAVSYYLQVRKLKAGVVVDVEVEDRERELCWFVHKY
jgi:hypothetical protein